MGAGVSASLMYRYSLLIPLLLSLGLTVSDLAANTVSCLRGKTERITSPYTVVDGDTLHLDDGRKLRLIGIDTPEIFHDGRPPEAYALKARAVLIRLLAENRPLDLQTDRQRHDHYGRLLVHLFAAGRNVEDILLRKGLATALYMAPDYRYASCYGAAEAMARRQGLGLWSLPRYQPAEASHLPGGSHGFHLLHGRINRIGKGHSALWLNLSPHFALRLAKTDLPYFQGLDPETLRGREITVRGWVYKRHGELRMRLRHPNQIDIIPIP